MPRLSFLGYPFSYPTSSEPLASTSTLLSFGSSCSSVLPYQAQAQTKSQSQPQVQTQSQAHAHEQTQAQINLYLP